MSEPSIICAGMAVVDVLIQGIEAFPRNGETGRVADISMATGGDACNQAMALAKLGNHVGLWAVVGNDAQGAFVRQQCATRGINTDGLFTAPDKPTATGIALIDKGGERSFLVKRVDTHHLYAPEHINPDLIRPGLKILSIGSLFCAEAFDRQAVAPLLRRAKAVGAITLADMVMDQRGYGLDDLSDVWPWLDYAAPSELEGELLTGASEPQAIAADFQRRGVKNVLVKQGPRGVTLHMGKDVFSCPAFKVPIADTTGAGDTFMGGFVHALAHDFAPQAALRFATAAAALSIQEVGAGAGLKDLKQVEAFLARDGR